MFNKITSWLFDPSGLTPHGFCLLWEPGLLWLHALSDIGIALSYFIIPFVLVAVLRLRPDIGFRPLFGLFAAFILLCGTGHWLDVLTIWVPAYGVEGVVKAVTAIASITTAITLWRIMPQALAWPSPVQLNDVNAKLLLVEQAESRMASTAREAIDARDALGRELARRELAEQALIETEERLRIILQSSIVEAICLLDPHGNIEHWNASAERINGYTSTEIIGRNFSVLFTPEDIASDEPGRMLAAAAETGRFATEGDRVRKDGTRFQARVAIHAVRRNDGTLRGFIKMTTDITNQRIEEEQRAILIEASPNGMMIVDEAGIIRLVNRQVETIFGYPRAALIGLSVETLVPEDFRAGHGVLRSKFTGGEDVRGMTTGREFTGRRADGSDVAIEILLSAVRTPLGRIVVTSLFDVTEQKRLRAEKHDAELRERQAIEATNASLARLSRDLTRARDRAEQASRAKSRFLAGMSHELRTPLSGIMGYAHLLQIEGGLNAVQEGRVNAMLASGKHLLEMIACVLDLSEIEAEHVTLQTAAVEPTAIAAACLDLVRPAAEAKGLALRFAATPNTPGTIVADPMRLRQVLLNLLGNAVKFTNQGGITVQLNTSADRSTIRFEVEDTGPGIPADQEQRLFNDFERLETAATFKEEGAGLGLAISSRVAALMGGRLGHSQTHSSGSVFWLELPLVATGTGSTDAAPGIEPVERPPAPIAGPLNVLVVDDVMMNRDIAGSFLRAAGHQVTCVESGAEAVAIAATTEFDVVLMDVRMPAMDGLEATRRIRALPGARGQVPIVALTAQAFTDQIAACRKAGMDSHLGKPFDPDMLLAAVAQAVKSGRQSVHHLEQPVPTTLPAPSVHPVLGSELPVLDPRAFDRTAAFLAPETVASYLETIVTIGEAVLQGLRAPAAPNAKSDAIVETAHKLAGSAGMLGCERVATLARRYERAVQTGAADVAVLADGLCAAIEATRAEIRVRLDQRVTGAALHPADAEPMDSQRS